MYDPTADDDLFAASKLPITRRHYAVAAALGSFWFFADGHAFLPVGVILSLIWVGRTFDVTYAGSIKYAYKVVLTSIFAAGVGLVGSCGPRIALEAHGQSIVLKIGAQLFSGVAAISLNF